MTRRQLITVVLAAAIFGACGTTKPAKLQVNTDYDSSVQWTELKSFRLASARTGGGEDPRYPRLERLVQDQLVDQLTDRGFVRAEDGPTDFRVAFELRFRGSDSTAQSTTQRGLDGQPTGVSGPGQTSSLIVRMLHPLTSATLWEGRVTGFTIGAATPEADIRKAVWRVLAEFPPITG